MPDLLADELALRTARKPYVSALVVWARSPTSGRPGDRALVTGDGRLSGWVGGSCSEPVVVREALAALADDRARMLHLGPSETVPPGREGIVSVPVACASEGEIEVFVEPHLPPFHVVGIGRAPVLDALAAMARAAGYEADVIERGADGLDLAPVGIGGRSAVIVATFGRYDEDGVEAALATEAAYVGLVASAKRATTVLGTLRASGAAAESLARVHAPAGLDLGHLTHTEISVAILADVVGTFSRGRAAAVPPGYPRDPQDAADPVCGMRVSRSEAADRMAHEGVEYVFCSSGCRRRFAADPAGFLRSDSS
ncbi:MAG: XdhC family protein [Streptosporangiaceae bacterium]